jgi:glycosyltransferase involved in cell wall biosynthesis
MNEPRISILTATLNAANLLPRLIACLRAQTDGDFEWVVADGGSTDGTQALLHDAADLRIRLTESSDFGIYDALNRAIRQVEQGYYLVVGADDLLFENAVADYRAHATTAGVPDFVAASIRQAGRTIPARSGLGWLYGMPGEASSHSVGLLIKRSCHDRFGLYSRHFPIAADQLFVKTALQRGATIERISEVVGEFGTDGTSGSDSLGLLTELFRVQVRTERSVALQYLIFAARLSKYYVKSVLAGRAGR